MPSPNQITTVVTPANSLALVSLDAAKDFLGINPDDETQDGKIGRQIAQVSAAANTYCDRIFARQSYRDEYRQMCSWLGYGNPLILSQIPIAVDGDGDPVLTATEDDTVVAVAEWLINRNTGSLYRLDASGAYSSWSGTLVAIEYDAGFDVIPEDVQAAALEWLAAQWRSRGRDPMLRSLDVPGVVSKTFWVDPSMLGMPAETKAILDSYRIISV